MTRGGGRTDRKENKMEKINVLLSLERLKQCLKSCEVNIQIFRSMFLSNPCNPLLGCPAPVPALPPEPLTSARP